MKHSSLWGFLALGLLFASSATAWDAFGHMEVAATAYELLTPQAKSAVAPLLRLNPNYKTWVNGVATSKRNKVAFVRAARWADDIKTKFAYTSVGDSPTGPHAADNAGYSDMLRHKYWHFIDLPFSPDGTPTVLPTAPNAKSQIELFRTTLASTTASADVKSYDLVWLIHLVGDVHQPLHATSRFTTALPQGDHGGNLVPLCSAPCKDELHAFWDNVLGTGKVVAPAITAAGKLSAPSSADTQITNVDQWLDESLQMAKSDVYAAPVDDGVGPFVLTATYKAKAKSDAMARVSLAGARLARLPNDAFP